MRAEIANVIEAARNLQIRIASDGDEEQVVIGGSRHDFPDRLKAVARSLEEFDRSGAKDISVSASMDPIKLRKALDGIFRWCRASGLDISDPHMIVASALGMSRAKVQGGGRAIPKYKVKGLKNSRGTSMTGSAPDDFDREAVIEQMKLKNSM